MSLLFGRLIQNFVVFTQGVNGDASDPAAAAALIAAEKEFTQNAASNAAALTYLGTRAMPNSSSFITSCVRCWPVCDDICLHERLGVYG